MVERMNEWQDRINLMVSSPTIPECCLIMVNSRPDVFWAMNPEDKGSREFRRMCTILIPLY